MSLTVTVEAKDGYGQSIYETTCSFNGISEEQAPAAAITFAINRLKEKGYEGIALRVATWVTRQHWVGK